MLEIVLFKIISLSFSLMILFLGFFFKKVNNGYHTPGTLYSYFWFFFTFFPIILIYNIPINPLTIFYIFSSALLFNIGSIFFNWKFASKKLLMNKNYLFKRIKINNLKIIFILFFFLSLIFLRFNLIQNGFNIQNFIIDFIGSSTEFSLNRTTDSFQYGLIGQLSNLFSFLVVIFGSLLVFFCNTKTIKIVFFILSFIPVTLSMLLQSSKIIFLYGILYYVSVFIILKIYSGERHLFKSSDLRKIFYASILFVPMIIISFKSREGFNQIDMIDLLPTVSSYLFGSIYAFSDFFTFKLSLNSTNFYIVEENLTLGYYSFKSIFDLFGGNKFFPIGYYDDFYSYNNFIQSNIFTYFRQLIQDFGLIGSLIFSLISGIIIHFFFYTMHIIRKPFFSITIFLSFIVFLGTSYLFNVFTSRTLFSVAFTIYLLLHLNDIIHRLVYLKKN